MDELNLYEDLDEFQEQQEKKSKELQEVEEKYQESLKTIEKLEKENKKLKKNIKRMELGCQSLLDTARSEIKRKNAEIERLRKEKDDICFRRKIPTYTTNTNENLRFVRNLAAKNSFRNDNTLNHEISLNENSAPLASSGNKYEKPQAPKRNRSQCSERDHSKEYKRHSAAKSDHDYKYQHSSREHVNYTDKLEHGVSDVYNRNDNKESASTKDYSRNRSRERRENGNNKNNLHEHAKTCEKLKEKLPVSRAHSRDNHKESTFERDYRRDDSREGRTSCRNNSKSSQNFESYSRSSHESRSRERDKFGSKHNKYERNRSRERKNMYTFSNLSSKSPTHRYKSHVDNNLDHCESQKDMNTTETKTIKTIDEDLSEEKKKNLTTKNTQKGNVNMTTDGKLNSDIVIGNTFNKQVEDEKAQKSSYDSPMEEKGNISEANLESEKNAQLDLIAFNATTTETIQLCTPRKVALYNEIFGKSPSDSSSTSTSTNPNSLLNNIENILAKPSQVEVITSPTEYTDIDSCMSTPINKTIEIRSTTSKTTDSIMDANIDQSSDKDEIDNCFIPNRKLEENVEALEHDIVNEVDFIEIPGLDLCYQKKRATGLDSTSTPNNIEEYCESNNNEIYKDNTGKVSTVTQYPALNEKTFQATSTNNIKFIEKVNVEHCGGANIKQVKLIIDDSATTGEVNNCNKEFSKKRSDQHETGSNTFECNFDNKSQNSDNIEMKLHANESICGNIERNENSVDLFLTHDTTSSKASPIGLEQKVKFISDNIINESVVFEAINSGGIVPLKNPYKTEQDEHIPKKAKLQMNSIKLKSFEDSETIIEDSSRRNEGDETQTRTKSQNNSITSDDETILNEKSKLTDDKRNFSSESNIEDKLLDTVNVNKTEVTTSNVLYNQDAAENVENEKENISPFTKTSVDSDGTKTSITDQSLAVTPNTEFCLEETAVQQCDKQINSEKEKAALSHPTDEPHTTAEVLENNANSGQLYLNKKETCKIKLHEKEDSMNKKSINKDKTEVLSPSTYVLVADEQFSSIREQGNGNAALEENLLNSDKIVQTKVVEIEKEDLLSTSEQEHFSKSSELLPKRDRTIKLRCSEDHQSVNNEKFKATIGILSLEEVVSSITEQAISSKLSECVSQKEISLSNENFDEIVQLVELPNQTKVVQFHRENLSSTTAQETSLISSGEAPTSGYVNQNTCSEERKLMDKDKLLEIVETVGTNPKEIVRVKNETTREQRTLSKLSESDYEKEDLLGKTTFHEAVQIIESSNRAKEIEKDLSSLAEHGTSSHSVEKSSKCDCKEKLDEIVQTVESNIQEKKEPIHSDTDSSLNILSIAETYKKASPNDAIANVELHQPLSKDELFTEDTHEIVNEESAITSLSDKDFKNNQNDFNLPEESMAECEPIFNDLNPGPGMIHNSDEQNKPTSTLTRALNKNMSFMDSNKSASNTLEISTSASTNDFKDKPTFFESVASKANKVEIPATISSLPCIGTNVRSSNNLTDIKMLLIADSKNENQLLDTCPTILDEVIADDIATVNSCDERNTNKHKEMVDGHVAKPFQTSLVEDSNNFTSKPKLDEPAVLITNRDVNTLNVADLHSKEHKSSNEYEAHNQESWNLTNSNLQEKSLAIEMNELKMLNANENVKIESHSEKILHETPTSEDFANDAESPVKTCNSSIQEMLNPSNDRILIKNPIEDKIYNTPHQIATAFASANKSKISTSAEKKLAESNLTKEIKNLNAEFENKEMTKENTLNKKPEVAIKPTEIMSTEYTEQTAAELMVLRDNLKSQLKSVDRRENEEHMNDTEKEITTHENKNEVPITCGLTALNSKNSKEIHQGYSVVVSENLKDDFNAVVSSSSTEEMFDVIETESDSNKAFRKPNNKINLQEPINANYSKNKHERMQSKWFSSAESRISDSLKNSSKREPQITQSESFQVNKDKTTAIEIRDLNINIDQDRVKGFTEKNEILLKKIITKEINIDGEIVEVVKDVVNLNEYETTPICENTERHSHKTEHSLEKIHQKYPKTITKDTFAFDNKTSQSIIGISEAGLGNENMVDMQIPSTEHEIESNENINLHNKDVQYQSTQHQQTETQTKAINEEPAVMLLSANILPEMYNTIPDLPSISTISPTPSNFSGIFSKNSSYVVSNEDEFVKSKKKSIQLSVKPKEYILPAASVLCNVDNLKNATKSNRKLHWELLDNKNEMAEIEDDADIDTTDDEQLTIKEEPKELKRNRLDKQINYSAQNTSPSETDIQTEEIQKGNSEKFNKSKVYKMKELKPKLAKNVKARLNPIGIMHKTESLIDNSLIIQEPLPIVLSKRPVGRPRKQNEHAGNKNTEIALTHKKRGRKPKNPIENIELQQELPKSIVLISKLDDYKEGQAAIKEDVYKTNSTESNKLESPPDIQNNYNNIETSQCQKPLKPDSNCLEKDTVSLNDSTKNITKLIDCMEKSTKSLSSSVQQLVISDNPCNSKESLKQRTTFETQESTISHKQHSSTDEIINSNKETEGKGVMKSGLTEFIDKNSLLQKSPIRHHDVTLSSKETEGINVANNCDKTYYPRDKVVENKNIVHVTDTSPTKRNLPVEENSTDKALSEKQQVLKKDKLIKSETLTKPLLKMKYKTKHSKNKVVNFISLEDIGIKLRPPKVHLSSYRIPKIEKNPEDTIDQSWKVEVYVGPENQGDREQEKNKTEKASNEVQQCESKELNEEFTKSSPSNCIINFDNKTKPDIIKVLSPDGYGNRTNVKTTIKSKCTETSSDIAAYVSKTPEPNPVKQEEKSSLNHATNSGSCKADSSNTRTKVHKKTVNIHRRILDSSSDEDNVNKTENKMKKTCLISLNRNVKPELDLETSLTEPTVDKSKFRRKSIHAKGDDAADIETARGVKTIAGLKFSAEQESSVIDNFNSTDITNKNNDNQQSLQVIKSFKMCKKSMYVESISVKNTAPELEQVTNSGETKSITSIKTRRQSKYVERQLLNEKEEEKYDMQSKKSKLQLENKPEGTALNQNINQQMKQQNSAEVTRKSSRSINSNNVDEELCNKNAAPGSSNILKQPNLISMRRKSTNQGQNLDVSNQEENKHSGEIKSCKQKVQKNISELRLDIDNSNQKVSSVIDSSQNSQNNKQVIVSTSELPAEIMKKHNDSCINSDYFNSEKPHFVKTTEKKLIEMRSKSAIQSPNSTSSSGHENSLNQTNINELKQFEPKSPGNRETLKWKRENETLLEADTCDISTVIALQKTRKSTNKQIILDSSSNDDEPLIKKAAVITSDVKIPLTPVVKAKQRRRRVVKVLSTSNDTASNVTNSSLESSTQSSPLISPNHPIFNTEVPMQSIEFAASLPMTPNQQDDNKLNEIDSKLHEMFQSPNYKTDYKTSPVVAVPKQTILPSSLSEFQSHATVDDTVDFNRENDQGSLNIAQINEIMTSSNSPAAAHNNSEIKHLSLGSAEYRFEKVSENVINLFISRKRKRKRNN